MPIFHSRFSDENLEDSDVPVALPEPIKPAADHVAALHEQALQEASLQSIVAPVKVAEKPESKSILERVGKTRLTVALLAAAALGLIGKQFQAKETQIAGLTTRLEQLEKDRSVLADALREVSTLRKEVAAVDTKATNLGHKNWIEKEALNTLQTTILQGENNRQQRWSEQLQKIEEDHAAAMAKLEQKTFASEKEFRTTITCLEQDFAAKIKKAEENFLQQAQSLRETVVRHDARLKDLFVHSKTDVRREIAGQEPDIQCFVTSYSSNGIFILLECKEEMEIDAKLQAEILAVTVGNDIEKYDMKQLSVVPASKYFGEETTAKILEAPRKVEFQKGDHLLHSFDEALARKKPAVTYAVLSRVFRNTKRGTVIDVVDRRAGEFKDARNDRIPKEAGVDAQQNGELFIFPKKKAD